MKIIFLDIDGVLNVIPKEFDEFGGMFHKDFVENLGYMIDETNAKIVITSTWRYAGLSEMQRMWKERGLPGEVIDVTLSEGWLRNSDYKDKGKYDLVRGDEIKYFCQLHNITNYVIIDDDTDMLKEQLENFVQTSENIDHPDCVDIGYGLTLQCTQKAIEILNRNNGK